MRDALYLGIGRRRNDEPCPADRRRRRPSSARLSPAPPISPWASIRAAAAIAKLLRAVLAKAGLSDKDRSRIHAGFGLAGANVPSLAAGIGAMPFGFGSVAVASDAVIACLGAHGGQDGAILDPRHRLARLRPSSTAATAVGGWGFALSDEVRGALLGRACLRAAILAVDGLAPATPLCAAAMARFDGDPAGAVVWVKDGNAARLWHLRAARLRACRSEGPSRHPPSRREHGVGRRHARPPRGPRGRRRSP